jgi:hypothetical protein
VAPTSKSAWKARERTAARLFGAERQVGSGSLGREDRSRSDSTHDRLFLETKLRARCAVRTLYDATRELAKKEDKLPVLALASKGRPGLLIVVHSDDLDSFAREVLSSTSALFPQVLAIK